MERVVVEENKRKDKYKKLDNIVLSTNFTDEEKKKKIKNLFGKYQKLKSPIKYFEIHDNNIFNVESMIFYKTNVEKIIEKAFLKNVNSSVIEFLIKQTKQSEIKNKDVNDGLFHETRSPFFIKSLTLLNQALRVHNVKCIESILKSKKLKSIINQKTLYLLQNICEELLNSCDKLIDNEKTIQSNNIMNKTENVIKNTNKLKILQLFMDKLDDSTIKLKNTNNEEGLKIYLKSAKEIIDKSIETNQNNKDNYKERKKERKKRKKVKQLLSFCGCSN